MDKNSTIGALFEQGKTVLDDSATNVVDTTKKQIMGNQTAANSSNFQGENVKAQLSEESREIVEDFYSPSRQTSQISSPADDPSKQLESVRAELMRLQRSLHQTEYYDPLFAYENKKKQEEAAVEDQEEEKNKMDELSLAEKKKQDLAKFRAERSTEIKGGPAG